MIDVRVVNGQARMPVRRARIEAAVRAALAGSDLLSAEIGVAVVDAPTIHEINRRHLGHDYPTDVLSFLLEESGGRLEGEIVVSADAAADGAPRYGWPPGDELLLYVVHGALHLIGLDDRTPGQRAAMRRRERACLAVLNVRTPVGRGRAGERRGNK